MSATIAVIGSGAVAAMMVNWLDLAGAAPVGLCARTPVTGFTITGDGAGGRGVRTVAVQPAPTWPVDWVLLTVKAQDTAATRPWLDILLGPDTVLVVLQNGVDHLERVQPLVGDVAVLPALVLAAAERTAPGVITHHLGNQLVVPQGPVAQRFADLCAGGVSVHQDPDFTTAAWRKLMVNVAANSITALTQRRAEVLRSPPMRQLCRTVLEEAVLAGQAAGARLGPGDVDVVLGVYDSYPEDNGSSMYYDRLAGRPLEYELIAGAVLRAAERAGVAVPVTRAIWTLLQAVSPTPRGANT